MEDGNNKHPSRFQLWDRKRNRSQTAVERGSSESESDSPSGSEDDARVSSPQKRKQKVGDSDNLDSLSDNENGQSNPGSDTTAEASEEGNREGNANLSGSGSNIASDASDEERVQNDIVPLEGNAVADEFHRQGGMEAYEEQEEGEEGSGEELAEEDASDQIDSEGSNDSNSEEAESTDEEEEDLDQDNLPLYEGARISFRQSLIAIITFALIHKLTGACLGDLLTLIVLHCGPNNICLKTLHKFKAYFSMIGKQVIKCHYYCEVCEVLLEDKDSVCGTCNGKHKVSYFIEFPIVKQLQIMYKRPGFQESLRFRFNHVKKNQNNLEDIYDGINYQEQIANGFLANPNNISFFMYFDGIALFKSSKFSIWPLYLTINELRHKDRTKKENIILAGIWFGKSKPNPNLFLEPLQNQMTPLQTEGVELHLPNNESVRVKAKIIGAVADMPAKSLFMRFTQYNGFHSCFNCMSTGGRYDLGNSTIQVFPYSRDFELRKNEDIPIFAEQAVIARQRDPEASVYGVRGPTIMYSLLPNMINSMAQDIMHGSFLGLTKTLLHLWFDTEHSNSPFSIAALVDVVDKRLANIKPPFSFQRVPRSIKKELALFKALDYKLFIMLYSLPVLCGILPDEYWEHHCKIVSALSLLSQESISLQQVDLAEELLHSYVRDFERLYSVRYLGLNVHQLLHLASITRHFGPNWIYSCFFYESLNGEFIRLVHGTRHAALQICSSSSVFMNLSVMINSMDECNAKAFCLKLLSSGKLKVKITENIDHQTFVVGKYKKCNNVPQDLRRLLHNTFNIHGGVCRYFFRLKKKE